MIQSRAGFPLESKKRTCLHPNLNSFNVSALGPEGHCTSRSNRAMCISYGHIPKFASVSAYMREVLHWLPVSQRILYKISALVWRSVTGCAPSYLTDLC